MGPFLAGLACPPSLSPPLAEAGLLPLAAKDSGVGIAIWIAFMVIAGIVNWIKSRAEESRAREAEERRRAAAQGLSQADPPRAKARDDEDEEEDDERAELRAHEEQEAKARLLEARAREQAARRQAEIDRAEREDAQRRRAALSGRQRGPQVTPLPPPAPVAVADAGFLTPGALSAPRSAAPQASEILPPEVASRLTEAQRFLVGTEILRAPRRLTGRTASRPLKKG